MIAEKYVGHFIRIKVPIWLGLDYLTYTKIDRSAKINDVFRIAYIERGGQSDDAWTRFYLIDKDCKENAMVFYSLQDFEYVFEIID